MSGSEAWSQEGGRSELKSGFLAPFTSSEACGCPGDPHMSPKQVQHVAESLAGSQWLEGAHLGQGWSGHPTRHWGISKVAWSHMRAPMPRLSVPCVHKDINWMLRGQSQPMLPRPGTYQYQDQHSFLVEKASQYRTGWEICHLRVGTGGFPMLRLQFLC